MVAFGWCVLLLVFVDEILAVAAFGAWGWQQSPQWLLVWLLPLVAMTVWFAFASPRARYGGSLRRPVVKIVVFGLASLALWDIGRHELAIGLLVFSVVVNALAQVPAIARLPEQARSMREPAA
ncbi:DUF2568 domain-containing protein [Nocardioides sp. LMS-CY]|uniref:DUF2568 domain-containing protein n=1 Tax=Nocardioides soli TaxID=1036020 RepID=A0A7W4VSJ3_9ACTN|nr:MULTISPECIES: YrdB family protein [Nocardioides]MBB3040929.1 hypothetical protein [Nocardioides soli]QWF23660.1 DUF2568 domain-containing protein [Nocardioides sp. LMS-CY]